MKFNWEHRKAMSARRYGRGTFEAHPNYLEYMEMIVDHPNYTDMPNARSEDGHINWQVSSGKTTSFYKFYENTIRDKSDKG